MECRGFQGVSGCGISSSELGSKEALEPKTTCSCPADPRSWGAWPFCTAPVQMTLSGSKFRAGCSGIWSWGLETLHPEGDLQIIGLKITLGISSVHPGRMNISVTFITEVSLQVMFQITHLI